MANKTDKKDNNPIAPEAIYAHYQKIRSVSSPVREPDSQLHSSAESSIDIDAANVDSTSAEYLYKHYQAIRVSESCDPIDDIMQKIDEQSVNRLVRQEGQPVVSQVAPDIHPIDARPVVVDEENQIDAPAANNSSIFKRWLLPAVAAAILSFVLIPQLMNTGSGPGPESLQTTLPSALSDKAAQTVAYIGTPQNSSFGFADTSNAAQVAFNNGVIFTDLRLLIDANQGAKIRVVLRALAAAQSSLQQNSTQNGIDGLFSTIQSSTASMDDAIVADASKSKLHEHLTKLGTALENMAAKTEQLDWYTAGGSVEAIRLAAEYALANTDVEPVEEALSLGSKIAQPATEAPASQLLPKLLQAELGGPEEFIKVAELLNDANDIKLLMQ